MTNGSRVLRVSTSIGMTWLWAGDAMTSMMVRHTLNGRRISWQPGRDGNGEISYVTDVQNGVTAPQACEALAAAGFTFGWHDSQPAAYRTGWPAGLPGMPAAG